MIVSLAELKTALEIDENDTTQDVALTDLIVRVGAQIESTTKRRFDTPVEAVETREGNGARKLYLMGHVDGPDIDAVKVERRAWGGEWEELTAGEDFDRVGDVLIQLPGRMWLRCEEYRLTYDDGYAEAPADIRALAIEMVAIQVGSDAAVASGESNVTSEKIGDYSYSSSSSNSSSSGGASQFGTTLSDQGKQTLNNRRRKLL